MPVHLLAGIEHLSLILARSLFSHSLGRAFVLYLGCNPVPLSFQITVEDSRPVQVGEEFGESIQSVNLYVPVCVLICLCSNPAAENPRPHKVHL